MIRIIDHEGNGYGAQAEITRKKGVNGEKSLTGTIYTNDEVLNGIDRGWKIEFEQEMYAFTFALPKDTGSQIELEFDAVHEFFFDMSKSSQNNLLNDGSHTFKAYLDFIFNGTDYTYRSEVDVQAFEKENFGQKNRLDLFYDVIKTAGVEFSVNGRVVRIIERVGNDLSTVVKKGFNLNELRLEKNIGDFVTYQKGFGAWTDDEDHSKGRLEVEYLSPLAEIYGRLDADPVVDERYTVKSNLENRLKSNVEGSYQISVQIDMEDLTRAGYEYKQPHEGDSIMAINKDLGFQRKVRIVSYETDFDVEGNILDHRITCNSVGMVQESIFGNASIKNSIKELQIDLELTRKQVIEWNVSADGKSTNYYGAIEPSPDDYKLSVGDTWYDSSGEETVIKVWNGVEWRKAGFDKDQFDREMAEVQAEIAETKQTADEAVNRINGEIAGKFTSLDTEISQVHQDAQNALNQAGEAVSQVAYFGETLDEFTQTVANIDGRVANIRHDVDGIKQTVTDHTGKIATVEHNVNGIQETVSDPVNGLVTQVSTLANGFNVLVDGMQNHKNLIPYWEIGGLKAADGSDYGAEDRIRTPLIKKRTNGSAVHRFSLDGVATNASYIIRYRADGSYYDTFTSTNFVTLTDAVPYARITITGNPSTLLKRKYQLEEGEVTPYVPYVSDVNQAQLSVLNDNINLRVRKDELLSQINVQSDNILIQSGKLYLDAETVAFSGKAFIPGAVIEDLSVDGAKIADASINSAKIISLDVDQLSGNKAELVQLGFNGISDSVFVNSSGLISNASNGSQGVIQNGVFLTRVGNTTLGYIGYGQPGSDNRPFYTINLSQGAHFRTRHHLGSENYKHGLLINAGAEYAEFNINRVHFNQQITLGNNANHAIASRDLYRLNIMGNESVGIGGNHRTVLAVSASNNTGYATFFANLNMNGYYINNAAGYNLRSERKYKSNIIPLEHAMREVERLNIYSYDKMDEDGQLVPELGIIVDEAPECVLGLDEKTVDIYSYISLIGKSQQELITMVKEMKEEIETLKRSA